MKSENVSKSYQVEDRWCGWDWPANLQGRSEPVQQGPGKLKMGCFQLLLKLYEFYFKTKTFG